MKKTISNLKNKKSDLNVNQSQLSNKCDQNQPLNVKKLVKPIDFEEIYFSNKNNISNDPNRSLVKIPDKDVEINRVARKQTVFNNGVPTNIDSIFPSNLLAQLCIEFYTSEWIVICYKELSYNGAFWCLPNVHSQLSVAMEQKFLIDEEKDKDNESILTFKTKGIYFEGQLAVCDLEDYQKFLKYREDELANVTVNISPGTVNNVKSAIPKVIAFSLSELSDGMKVLKESMPRDGRVQVILYLDTVDSIREIGEYWISLSFKGKQKVAYLYTGGKENQKLWYLNLKDAIETAVTKVEVSGSLESLERAEDTAQGMLSKILQESEQSITSLRRKDHQKLLAICPDVRDHIKKKSKPIPFYETGLIEKSSIDDVSIRSQIEQTRPRRYLKLTAQKFLTGLQIPQENNAKDVKILPEPFFVTCCLIHIIDGRRISEEFHWNPNHPSIENLLPQELFVNKWSNNQAVMDNGVDPCNKTPLELPTFPNYVLQKSKSFLVKSPYPQEQIGILVKVEKVFSGIISSSVDKYIKYGGMLQTKLDGEEKTLILENGDTKIGQSVHKAMSTFCSNIGNYRMPFCWSIGRMSTEGSLKLRLFKYDGNKTADEDLFKQIHVLNQEGTNKVATIPGFLELTITEMSEDSMNEMSDLVSNELVCKIKANTSDEGNCCKEIKEFIFDPIKVTNVNPQSTYSKNTHSNDQSSNPGSKSNSNYGSQVSLHYSDDNSPGDVTPPGDLYFSNPQTKSFSYTKMHSTSLGRISGNELSQILASKSLDIADHSCSIPSVISQEDLVSPFLDFAHCLYLYPRMLNFSNQNSFHRARNLSCYVELRDSDKIESSTPLKAIFTRASNKQPAFDSWANTAVIYHDSNPTFNEEIKIAIPINLHSKHHLLFRFYHVSCDTAGIPNVRDKASNKKHIETAVGFAWYPLLDKLQNLNNGTFHLPVSANLVSDYLDNKNQINSFQWVDGQKSLFSIILKPESTIFTQNPHLHRFFRTCTEKQDILTHVVEKNDSQNGKPRSGSDPKDPLAKTSSDLIVSPIVSQNDEVEIKNAIKALGTVAVNDLLLFIVPTFNQLLIIMVNTCSKYVEISKTAVTSIIVLSSSLRGQYVEAVSSKAIKRNTKVLKNYIKYSFDADKIAPPRFKRTVHESFVQIISELIRPPFRDTNLMNSFLSNSFLLYSIIVKSMIQSSTKQTKLTIDRSGEKLFTTGYMANLENMFYLIINCILEVSSNGSAQQQGSNASQRNQLSATQSLASSANKDLARFIARLLNVMDRGFVFQRIHQYMKIINTRIDSNGSDRDHLLRMKLEFLEIFCQHEHFIPLNLISLVHQAAKAPPSPEMLLSEKFCQQHYLVGLVLQQVHQQMCNTSSSAATRRLPFILLRNLLAKHIFDDRYNSNSAQQARIAGLYLPLVAIILENQRALCMPGTHYSTKSIIQNSNDLTDRSLSSRPLSSFSGDTISTHSSMNGSGSEGAGGSIYGVGFGCGNKPTRSSQMYMDKDGQVDSHFLNMIAGLNTEGTLRNLSTRRHVDSDTSSVHSTSTLIGLEEMNEKEETCSLSDEIIVHTKIEFNDTSKRSSLQRPIHSNNSSLGKKAGLSLALNLKKPPSINLRSGTNATGNMLNKNNETKSSILLNEKTQKDVFICLLHIFSTISVEDMKTSICNLTVQERAELLQLMIYAIHHLKYQGRKVINNFESISTSGLKSSHGQVQLRSNAAKTNVNGLMDDLDQGNTKAILEGNVSTEVGLIVLDMLSVYCLVYKQEILTYTPDHVIFRRIIDVYLTLLVVNQSDTVLRHVLVSMRVFVATFAKVIFASCHSVICDLSLQVLRYCDSASSSVRLEACGFLYKMMRCSYETFNKPGFNRVHLQMIVAVSKLDRIVGRRFNQSLNYLRRLSELEIPKTVSNPPVKPRPPTHPTKNVVKMNMQLFFEEVSDLTQRIRTVLMATVQMNEHKDDPEMLVDLQYSLAKSYSSNPALRRTWLEKIYAVHEKTHSRAEMAMCKAHIVAMISEYLKKKELYSIGCASFKNISPNIPKEESGMRDDSAQLEVHYTKEEVVQLLRELALEFDSAGLWEVLRHIYKLIIPMYEKKRDYEQLAQIYQHLAAAYIKIKNAEATNQRLIGSYYRVVLYGKPFESLAGKVFIYRLDSGKQFCVAREELQQLFENKYGAEKVQMLVENHVDRGKLDPELASIQVTHVDPFFDEEEELERQSMFESQYNISKFLLETPFVKRTQSGEDAWWMNEDDDDIEGILRSKQTDDLSIQWKRRTILTVEASFPHLKRRLEVISTKEIDFSPIERAIDEIKSKNRQLLTHLAFSKQSGDDSKSSSSTVSGSAANNSSHSGNINLLMDMHLTGALLPQVNQGPMAYARVFLQKENQINLPTDKVKQLKIQFMEFLSLCHLLLCDYYELMSHVHEPKYQAMKGALDKYRVELSNLLKEEITLDEEKMIISTIQLSDHVKKDLTKRMGNDNNNA